MDICYIVTARGTTQLVVEGFPFTKLNERAHMTFWACCQARPLSCTARATTYRGAKNGKITFRGEHNHGRIRERRKAGALRKLLEQRNKEKAQQKMLKNIGIVYE